MKPLHALISDSLLAGGTSLGQVRRRSCAFAGVMSSLLALAAAPAYADPRTIKSFDECLNSKSTTTANTVADAVACVPAGCFTTVTMSEESAQPGCKLRDGTRLPRVIFSCPGASGSLRFRPSFSLCTQGDVFTHIEVGEDVLKSTRTDDPALKNFPYLQKMADIDTNHTPWNFNELMVLDAKSPGTSKGCAECHDRMGTLPVDYIPAFNANLFLPIPPVPAEGTIFTNDPAVNSSGVPQTSLSDICTGIASSKQLDRSPMKKVSVSSLCAQLDFKSQQQ
jgi:hypothetical protein